MPPRSRPILIALPLALCWGSLILQLSAQWTLFEQYTYGWAVPALCLYLAWGKTGRVRQGFSQPADRGNARAPGLAYVALLAAAAALFPIRLLHEANPVWRLTSWAWALAAIAITLAVLYLTGGSQWLRRFWFPVAFFLVAVPWPTPIETRLVRGLTQANTAATVEVLGLLGIPALQHGNVIEVVTGPVGIDEACSGIRSFQATLMIALFLGEFFRLGLRRRLGLVLAGFSLSFLFNLVRTTLLAVVAAKNGSAEVSAWHDPAGVAILVTSFLSLWGVSLWLSNNTKPADIPVQLPDASPIVGPATHPLPSFLLVSLTVWVIAIELGNEAWYRYHESRPQGPGWTVDPVQLGSRVERVSLSSTVTGQFNADENLCLRWTDSSGNGWVCYYFRWEPSRSRGRRVAANLARVHGPETCLPAVGLKQVAEYPEQEFAAGDLSLALQQSVYQGEGTRTHVFYGIYEDLLGPTVLSDRGRNTANRVRVALQGRRRTGQRFLELGVVGPSTPEEAQKALIPELTKLLRVGTPERLEAAKHEY